MTEVPVAAGVLDLRAGEVASTRASPPHSHPRVPPPSRDAAELCSANESAEEVVPGGPGLEDDVAVAVEVAASNLAGSEGRDASGEASEGLDGANADDTAALCSEDGAELESPELGALDVRLGAPVVRLHERELDRGSSGSDEAGAINGISLVEVSPSDASSNLDAAGAIDGSSLVEGSLAEASGARGCEREVRGEPTGVQGMPAAAGVSDGGVTSEVGVEIKGDLDGGNGLAQGGSELRIDGSYVEGGTEMSGASSDGVDTMETTLEEYEASHGSTRRVQEGVDRMETSLDDSEVSDGSTTQDSDTDVETESSGSSIEEQDTGYGVHIPRMEQVVCEVARENNTSEVKSSDRMVSVAASTPVLASGAAMLPHPSKESCVSFH